MWVACDFNECQQNLKLKPVIEFMNFVRQKTTTINEKNQSAYQYTNTQQTHLNLALHFCVAT